MTNIVIQEKIFHQFIKGEMTDSELNNFVYWYLKNRGYEKTLKKFKKSVDLETKKNISDEQIKNFEKILKKLSQQPKENF